MINKKKAKKKNSLPIILVVSIFLIIVVYVFNYYSYLDDLNIYFRNVGASIENIFSIKIDNLDDNVMNIDPSNVISTGFKELDEKLIGWKRGEDLIVFMVTLSNCQNINYQK